MTAIILYRGAYVLHDVKDPHHLGSIFPAPFCVAFVALIRVEQRNKTEYRG